MSDEHATAVTRRARLMQREDVREYVERVAASAPPLTQQQRSTLTRLLASPRAER